MKNAKVTMKKSELLKEHRRLIKVLREAKTKDAKKEAKLQSREMKEYR